MDTRWAGMRYHRSTQYERLWLDESVDPAPTVAPEPGAYWSVCAVSYMTYDSVKWERRVNACNERLRQR